MKFRGMLAMSRDCANSVTSDDVQRAKQLWYDASAKVAEVENSLPGPGDGYGDGGQSQRSHEQRLASARRQAEERFREYDALSRRHTEAEMLRLQRSQSLATWASFAVAVVVGIAQLSRR